MPLKLAAGTCPGKPAPEPKGTALTGGAAVFSLNRSLRLLALLTCPPAFEEESVTLTGGAAGLDRSGAGIVCSVSASAGVLTFAAAFFPLSRRDPQEICSVSSRRAEPRAF